jgi:hypothetical protein
MRLIIKRSKNGTVMAESVEPPRVAKVPAAPPRSLDEAMTVLPEAPDLTRKRLVVEDTHKQTPDPTRKRIVRDATTGEVTVEGGAGPGAASGFDDHVDDPLADDEVFGDEDQLAEDELGAEDQMGAEDELADLFGKEPADTEDADAPDDNADVVAMEAAAKKAAHEKAVAAAEKAAAAQVAAAKNAEKKAEAAKAATAETDAPPKYACDQCDFVAATGSGLASHKAAKHE